jgi:hypothetical protein
MITWLHMMIIHHSWVLSGLLSLIIVLGSALIAAWVWIERLK